MRRRPSALARAIALATSTLVAGAIMSTAAGSAFAADSSGAQPLSGAYAGGLGLDHAKTFGSWRGRPVAVTNDFLPGDSWAGVEAPDWWTGAWSGSGTRMVVGVPILPGPSGSTTLSQGATGAYDDHFRTLATRLVDAGMSDAILRLGWEQNGNWYAWSANGHAADYVTYWQHIVTAMRSVAGAHFAFAWNPTLGAGTYGSQPDQAWPGSAYVDTIALDVYDSMWGNSTAGPAERWAAVQNGTYNLDWWASFAASHGNLPLSFPEWGLVAKADQNGGGGGDNPTFITNFLAWIASHHVMFETYFEVNAQDGNHLLEGGAFPQAAAAYRAAITAAPAAVAPASAAPSAVPAAPSAVPAAPTAVPTAAPTAVPTAPSVAPTVAPTALDTAGSALPTVAPTAVDSAAPAAAPVAVAVATAPSAPATVTNDAAAPAASAPTTGAPADTTPAADPAAAVSAPVVGAVTAVSPVVTVQAPAAPPVVTVVAPQPPLVTVRPRAAAPVAARASAPHQVTTTHARRASWLRRAMNLLRLW